jgi:cysteine synthase A
MNEYNPMKTIDWWSTVLTELLFYPELSLNTVDANSHNTLYDKLESLIGNTPCEHIYLSNGSSIWRKDETWNPTGSHYDRATLKILKQYELDSIISHGDNLIEVSSGSLGISFAYYGCRLGYKVTVVVPPELPPSRVQPMKDFGADIIVSPSGYITAAMDNLRRLMLSYIRGGYEVERINHYGSSIFRFTKESDRKIITNNSQCELSPRAFSSIAEELICQLPSTVNITHFVSALGNGSTLKGISEVLRQRYPDIKIVGAEDKNSPVHYMRLYGKEETEKALGHPVEFRSHQSFGLSFRGVPAPLVEQTHLDEIRLASEDDLSELRIAANSGKKSYETSGNSSLHALYHALAIAKEQPGSQILVLKYDNGGRYGEIKPASLDEIRPPKKFMELKHAIIPMPPPL